MADYTTPGGPLRQSLLRQFDRCPLSAKMSVESFDGWSTGPQALGTAFHAVAEEILRTLNRTGNDRIPTQEAVEVMYEVVARTECPHLSGEALRDLLTMVIQFAGHRWSASRIMELEHRLSAEVLCPDGKTRTLTGQPDVLIAQAPSTAVCVDYKTGWQVPPAPRDGDWDKDSGRPYLSERGSFQLDAYGYLIMSEYSAVQKVVLREFFPRVDETREASLHRGELEHVERRLGVLLMRLEQTLLGEIEAEARPGSWCKGTCPRMSECPIWAEERGEGAIETSEQAEEWAGRFIVTEGLRERDRKALKAYHEATGEAIPCGDGWVGWCRGEQGRRKFGFHTTPSVEPEEQDMAAALEESLRARETV